MAQTLPATLLEAPRKDSGLEQGDAVLESKGAEFLAYAETILTDENLIEAALRDRGTQNFHRKYPNYGRPARGWGSYRLGDPK